MANLQRFHDAQKSDYQKAHDEIASGRKQSHWIWYIFPQLKSLGLSDTAQRYGIADFKEACDYLNDPILFERYLTMVKLINDQLEKKIHPATLMNGVTDAQKLVSSLTLYHSAAEYLGKNELKDSCSKALNYLANEGYIACERTMNEIYEYQLTAGVHDKDTADVEDISTAQESTPQTTTKVEIELNSTPNAATTLKVMVDTLAKSIEKKAGTRSSWFTLNTETKVEKLKAISRWLEKHPLNEQEQEAIVALIRDTCAIKRNIFGLFEPHSLQEFHTLLKTSNLKPASAKISFTSKELAQIKTHTQVAKLIQEKITPQHAEKYSL
ncbi:DUF1810 domain-containing protein [Legionella jamestowniensis]|uniref:Calpastatin n=1 Tax=Legionella jamestowniensis TaxID=455 RepID=A0A0W0UGT6_9GAMM|nr:DUF1810 family protein [Legionella jamestowniensis]KTD07124.1 hypothetical protein Ljam_1319 [Legionella jamestowniensis]SFL71246.1 Uncharacterized protein, DUF1810 family [Legionella jamestowniensis DSM 19215]